MCTGQEVLCSTSQGKAPSSSKGCCSKRRLSSSHRMTHERQLPGLATTCAVCDGLLYCSLNEEHVSLSAWIMTNHRHGNKSINRCIVHALGGQETQSMATQVENDEHETNIQVLQACHVCGNTAGCFAVGILRLSLYLPTYITVHIRKRTDYQNSWMSVPVVEVVCSKYRYHYVDVQWSGHDGNLSLVYGKAR